MAGDGATWPRGVRGVSERSAVDARRAGRMPRAKSVRRRVGRASPGWVEGSTGWRAVGCSTRRLPQLRQVLEYQADDQASTTMMMATVLTVTVVSLS